MTPLVTPREGQSLDGLLMDAAAALGERSVLALTRAAGVRWGHLPRHRLDPKQLAVVAEAIGVDPAELASRSYRIVEGPSRKRSFHDVPVAIELIETRRRLFSPGTLRSEPWHRAAWQLRLLPFCERTWTRLTDSCGRCGTVQRWQSAHGSDLCDRCGRPLADGSTADVPEDERAALHGVAGLVSHDPARRAASLNQLPETLRGLRPEGCVEVASALACLVEPRLRSGRRRFLPSPHADACSMSSAMARAWRLMTDWPNAPLAACDDLIAARPGRRGDGAGGVTRALLRLPLGGGETEASPSLAIAASELRSVVLERQKRACASNPFARLARVAPRQVTLSCRQGRLRSVLGITRQGELVSLLPMEQAAISRDLVERGITLEGVAARIGCTFRAVEEMIAMGLLVGRVPPVDTCLTVRARILPEDLEAFTSRLSVIAGSPGPDDLPLERAMAAIGGRPKPWAAALSAMLDGRLPFAMADGPSRLTRRLSVDRRDVPLLTELRSAFADCDPRFDPWMSMTDASDALNARLGRCPRLRSALERREGHARSVRFADVVAMSEDVVSFGELAARCGTTASAIGRICRSIGIEATSPPFIMRTQMPDVAAAVDRIRGVVTPGGSGLVPNTPVVSFERRAGGSGENQLTLVEVVDPPESRDAGAAFVGGNPTDG